MLIYNYLLNFEVGSLNTDKTYNIYYDGGILAERVSFPYTLSFFKWQETYDIIVENTICGSRKSYTLIGTSTTTFPVATYPTTNPVWLRPTTTVRPAETTQPVPSTTSKSPKSIFIDTLNVKSCVESSDGVLVSTVITFTGNYSGKLFLQITDVNSGIIVRRFDGGIITTKTIKYNLHIGNYKFEIKDAEDETVTAIRPNIYIYCPPQSFKVEYIANTCGKNDAKLRIYDIVGANKFRWCAGSTFICDNLFSKPDAIVDDITTEVFIELYTGQIATYTNGSYISVRGFNHSEIDYKDVAIEVKPCIPNTTLGDVYVTALFRSIKPRTGGNTVNVSIYLVQDGKKIISPTNISVSGQFTVFINDTFVNTPFDMTINEGALQSNATFDIATDSIIFESCITELNPTKFGIYTFINNGGCN